MCSEPRKVAGRLAPVHGRAVIIAFLALFARRSFAASDYYRPPCEPFGLPYLEMAAPSRTADSPPGLRSQGEFRSSRPTGLNGLAHPFSPVDGIRPIRPEFRGRDDVRGWTSLPTLGFRSPAMIVDPVRNRLVLYASDRYRPEGGATWVRSLAGDEGWHLLEVPGPGPGFKEAGCTAYDPVRQRMILFGGLFTNGVWALDLNGSPRWHQLAPAGSGPGDRYGATMVYDPGSDRVIVFGGSSPPLQDDVWAFALGNGSGWSKPPVVGGPPAARFSPACAFDPLRHRMLIFSGYEQLPDDVNPISSADLWALSMGDTLVWTRISTSGDGPPGLALAAASFDVRHDRLVLFGGAEWRSDAQREAWSLQFGTIPHWSKITPDSMPPPRAGAAMVYDARRDRFVAYGGSATDTWELSLEPTPHWFQLDSGEQEEAAAGYAANAVYDGLRKRVLQLGGHFQFFIEGGWYDYDGSYLTALSFGTRPQWRFLSNEFETPRGYGRALIVDPDQDRLVSFGGGSREDDRWFGLWQTPLRAPENWNELSVDGPSPEVRIYPSGIYDPLLRQMIVFGGRHATALDDTWSLSLTGPPRWSQFTPDGPAPPARFGHSAIFDPERRRMIMFGGTNDSTVFGDTWELSLEGRPRWHRIASDEAPPPRAFASMVYDSKRHRVILMGGRDAAGNALGDTWVLPVGERGGWREAREAGELGARWGAPAVYDPDQDAVIVLGGTFDPCNPSNAIFQEGVFRIWRLSGEPEDDPGRSRVSAGMGLATVASGTLTLSAVSPSSIRGGLDVVFALPEPGPARLELLDVAGRRIAVHEIDGSVIGQRTVRIAEPGTLPAGVYLARLRQGNAMRVTRVVVLP
jgi:hypothetical protein